MPKKKALSPKTEPMRSDFFQEVATILRNARHNAYRAINFAMVEAYWQVGRMIVEEEQ